MLIFLVSLAAAVPQLEFTDARAYGAIWEDAEANAMIGNWNQLVTWEWFDGARDKAPTIHIDALACRPDGADRMCSWTFRRVMNQAAADDATERQQPARLACEARFRVYPANENDPLRWEIVHTRPPYGHGHSATSMRCEVPGGALAN